MTKIHLLAGAGVLASTILFGFSAQAQDLSGASPPEYAMIEDPAPGMPIESAKAYALDDDTLITRAQYNRRMAKYKAEIDPSFDIDAGWQEVRLGNRSVCREFGGFSMEHLQLEKDFASLNPEYDNLETFYVGFEKDLRDVTNTRRGANGLQALVGWFFGPLYGATSTASAWSNEKTGGANDKAQEASRVANLVSIKFNRTSIRANMLHQRESYLWAQEMARFCVENHPDAVTQGFADVPPSPNIIAPTRGPAYGAVASPPQGQRLITEGLNDESKWPKRKPRKQRRDD